MVVLHHFYHFSATPLTYFTPLCKLQRLPLLDTAYYDRVGEYSQGVNNKKSVMSRWGRGVTI